MAKRQTGIRLSELTDRQIADFIRDCAMTQSEVMTVAVDRFHQQEYTKRKSGAAYAPIYRAVYVNDKSGDISVTGDYDATLKEVSIAELEPGQRFYIAINHPVEWPYGAIDFTETLDDFDRDLGLSPRQFCEAVIVTTPKLHLV